MCQSVLVLLHSTTSPANESRGLVNFLSTLELYNGICILITVATYQKEADMNSVNRLESSGTTTCSLVHRVYPRSCLDRKMSTKMLMNISIDNGSQ